MLEFQFERVSKAKVLLLDNSDCLPNKLNALEVKLHANYGSDNLWERELRRTLPLSARCS